MLNSIVRASLRLRVVVIALSAALLAWGFHVTRNARLDVFPDFAEPQVTVQTEAPGFTAEQVERLVTARVEAVLNGAGGLEALRSQSIQGLSIVTAVFREGTQPIVARQSLAERLAELSGELPAGVRAPKLTPLTSATMDLLKIGLVSDSRSQMELRRFARWVLQPRLSSVEGVANVSIFGGQVEEMQVQLDPERMNALGVVVEDVISAARNATGLRGAGFVESSNQRVLIETHGAFSRPEDLAAVVVVTHGDQSVRLGDVAQGREGVLLTMLS